MCVNENSILKVEEAATLGWERHVGSGQIIGMKRFGASAPFKDLQKNFGFTVERIVAVAKAEIEKKI